MRQQPAGHESPGDTKNSPSPKPPSLSTGRSQPQTASAQNNPRKPVIKLLIRSAEQMLRRRNVFVFAQSRWLLQGSPLPSPSDTGLRSSVASTVGGPSLKCCREPGTVPSRPNPKPQKATFGVGSARLWARSPQQLPPVLGSGRVFPAQHKQG